MQCAAPYEVGSIQPSAGPGLSVDVTSTILFFKNFHLVSTGCQLGWGVDVKWAPTCGKEIRGLLVNSMGSLNGCQTGPQIGCQTGFQMQGRHKKKCDDTPKKMVTSSDTHWPSGCLTNYEPKTDRISGFETALAGGTRYEGSTAKSEQSPQTGRDMVSEALTVLYDESAFSAKVGDI
jgi:hypothetical protein